MAETRPQKQDRNKGETRRLARFCADLQFDELDQNVIEAAEKSFVDTIAACYSGTVTDPGELMLNYVSSFGGDEATVIGDANKTLAQFSAMANGTTAHALDVDDGHRAASVHPGSSTIPAALAMAEKYDRSGKELLTAIVVGYEATIKTAVAVQTSHRERHFHATATCGCFGAAAAASHLLRLDETKTAHALGLAGTQAGGLFEFLKKGSMAKRFHPGRAAMAGITAAELAAEGFDGPDTIIEGEEGFAKGFSDQYDLSVYDQLGDPYSITRVYLKPYPCCRHIHGPVEAIKEIRNEGVEPSNVDRIRIETYQSAAYHDKKQIENLLDAQMSIPYGVAISFISGKAMLDQFDPSHANDADVATLIDATEIVATDEMESLYPEARPATVIVETNDGNQYKKAIKFPLGAAETPISKDRLERKFRDITVEMLTTEQQDNILQTAFNIKQLDSIRILSEKL